MADSKQYLEALDKTLRHIVDTRLRDEDGFGLMLRYAMGWLNADGTPYHQPSGKRLRPLLLFLCAEAAHGDWQKTLPAAAAVELLHNFSLIHDDIQDNSETRHNRPTVWKIWGVANAINAGDAMFTLAYQALESLTGTLSADQLLYLWRVFNATNIELTRGQHLDMRFETQPSVSVADYISMIKGKSAALIATSALFGAFIPTADVVLAEYYASFGLNLGIAFQIHDDILGIWGDPSLTGKSVATDIVSRKKSLPVLYGLERSTELAEMYARPSLSDEDVLAIVERLTQLGAQEYAAQEELAYYTKAKEALAQANPRQETQGALEAFIAFLFNRSY